MTAALRRRGGAEADARKCTAFVGARLVATGGLEEVAVAVWEELGKTTEDAAPMIFDDETGEAVELDLRGSAEDVVARLRRGREPEPRSSTVESKGPGRPRLGVVGREVTLLPRHWEWLDEQTGGASVTLRKLVEAARRGSQGADRARRALEAAYRFLSAMAGNLPGFEEASRVLFSKGRGRLATFRKLVRDWPEDVRKHAIRMVRAAVEAGGD